MEKRAKFIVFEGIDGSGKTTQIKRFVSYLFDQDKHNHIIFTRNPYKDVNIRKILREDNDPMSKAELITDLYIKDRENHVKELILPNLDNEIFIICDRYKLSTIAYQTTQGQDMDELIERQKELPIPDITFMIDLSAIESSKRMKNEVGRNEHKFEANLEFLERVRKNYLKINEKLPDEKIIIIDGTKDIESVTKEIIERFEEEFN